LFSSFRYSYASAGRKRCTSFRLATKETRPPRTNVATEHFSRCASVHMVHITESIRPCFSVRRRIDLFFGTRRRNIYNIRRWYTVIFPFLFSRFLLLTAGIYIYIFIFIYVSLILDFVRCSLFPRCPFCRHF